MNIGSNEKKIFYLNEAMSRSKIDTLFLAKSLKKLLHNYCTQGITEGKKSNSVLNAASCLRVISILAHHMSHTDIQELSLSLQIICFSTINEENTVRLERMVYLVGEVSTIGFAIDDEFTPKLGNSRNIEEKNSSPLTDSLRGLFVRPPSRLL